MRVEIVQSSLDSVVSFQPLAAPGSWKVRWTVTILCRPANVNGLLHISVWGCRFEKFRILHCENFVFSFVD
jgi:hypothetical protein